VPNVEPPEPTRLGEVVWLEPFPDALLEGAIDAPLGPEARYEQTESISLAFVTALQILPPRQLAVLVLRDVLGFHADEVADMLDSSVDSVKSALKRARASLQQQSPTTEDRPLPPAADSPVEGAIVAKFIRAWESADLDGLVALLTDDVFMSMPPMPFEYEGRDVVASFCASIFKAGRRFDLVPTRANGQPAFGAYLRSANGISHGIGLYVLALAGDRIRAMIASTTQCSHGSGYRDRSDSPLWRARNPGHESDFGEPVIGLGRARLPQSRWVRWAFRPGRGRPSSAGRWWANPSLPLPQGPQRRLAGRRRNGSGSASPFLRPPGR